MGKFNFVADEAAILKAYRISSLDPQVWEDVDHELSDSLAGAITSGPGGGPEGADYGDPLGINDRGLDVASLDLESKAAVLISSKSFDPKAFLSTAHPNATYQDLTAGTSHLRKILDSRSEAIRVLVEDNFDHFVAVKAATDALHHDMQSGLLADEAEYGSKPLRDRLKQASLKADQVFLPILENAAKAQRVRSTLGVFERSKFFFNLPGSLVESIEAGRFDVALRDYNKGKFLLESRPAQLVSSTNSSSSSSNTLDPQHKRIVDKVWGAVEKVMGEMRALLIEQLKEPTRTVEEHEKTIEVLLEMNTADDPVWVYFDSQHKYILNRMQEAHAVCLKAIQDVRDKMSSNALKPSSLAKDLQTSISALGTAGADAVHTRGTGADVWTAIHAMVKTTSEVILSALPPFWKIAKDYMDGKFKKVSASGSTSSRRSPLQCRTMALDIVELYISLLSEFFTLSDKAVAAPSSATGVPPFVPPGSNSLTTAYYVSKILGEMNDCVNDVMAIELAGEANAELKSLIESAKWRFEDALCDTWMKDANSLHNLETWQVNPERPSTTVYLSNLHAFQKHATTSAYKLATGSSASSSSSQSSSRQNPIGRDFAAKIQKAFIDSLYALLDGLERLSRKDYIPPEEVADLAIMAEVGGSGNVGASGVLLDVTNLDTRMLLIISSFDVLSTSIIPSMINQLESALGASIGQERNSLIAVMEEMDKTLFGDYTREKAQKLASIIRKGVLESDLDWYETSRPTEVRDYMYEALLYLVSIHSHVSVVARTLLDRTMIALVEDLTTEALSCFQQVQRFGMGGMLRATLEIEFLHQTLVQYVSPSASQTLTAIYSTISAAYSRKPGNQQENLQRELDGVKKTLQESRRSTAIEFLCFKPTKSSKDRDRDRDRDSEMAPPRTPR